MDVVTMKAAVKKVDASIPEAVAAAKAAREAASSANNAAEAAETAAKQYGEHVPASYIEELS